MRYFDGCCEKCKLEPLALKNCLAQSLAETETIGMIEVQMPPHGTCKNRDGVRGITHCQGSCKSGTKFDPCELNLLINFQLNYIKVLINFFSDFQSNQRV